MTLSEQTTQIKDKGGKALVPFFTAGYPDEQTFLEVVRAAVEAGADVVEVGVPFSDPIADGPTIQMSSTIALESGMTLTRALELARSMTASIPLVIMSYINPIMAYGLDRFVADARGAGVSGTILPDVSFEESHALRDAFTDGMDYIDLLAPTSSDERVEAIAAGATGFVYLVSVTGVTGARRSLSDSLPAFVSRVREKTSTPLYVGFGVSSADQAARVVESADGVIIGSELIRLIDDGERKGAASRVSAFLTDVRTAIGNS